MSLATEDLIKSRSGQFDLEDVLVLKLNGAGLTSISASPSALLRCSNLTHLELRKNELKTLDGIEALPNLEKLDVSDNKIANLSPLGFLMKLVELNVASNAITDLKQLEHLKGLAELRSLTVGPGRGNTIISGDRHVPFVVEQLPQVLTLDGQSTAVVKANKAAMAVLVKSAQRETGKLQPWLDDAARAPVGPAVATELASKAPEGLPESLLFAEARKKAKEAIAAGKEKLEDALTGKQVSAPAPPASSVADAEQEESAS